MESRKLKHLLVEKVPQELQQNPIFKELLSAVEENNLKNKKEISDWLDSQIAEGKAELLKTRTATTMTRIRVRIGEKLDHLEQMKAIVKKYL